MALNFNSMMLLFFILRYFITFLRKLGFVGILPLDQHIYLHKIAGSIIFFQAWFHGIMHFVNFCKLSAELVMVFISPISTRLGSLSRDIYVVDLYFQTSMSWTPRQSSC